MKTFHFLSHLSVPKPIPAIKVWWAEETPESHIYTFIMSTISRKYQSLVPECPSHQRSISLDRLYRLLMPMGLWCFWETQPWHVTCTGLSSLLSEVVVALLAQGSSWTHPDWRTGSEEGSETYIYTQRFHCHLSPKTSLHSRGPT